MTQVPADHPLMVAWRAYEQSFDYKNAHKWAQRPEHTDGALWAAFMAGFKACAVHLALSPGAEGAGSVDAPVEPGHDGGGGKAQA